MSETTVRFRRMNGLVACQFCRKGDRREEYLIGNEERRISIQVCAPCGAAIRQGFRPAEGATE